MNTQPFFAAGGPGHNHAFDAGNRKAETGTRRVMWITLVTMVLEITVGWVSGSMALLADGWHMSSHAFALGLAAFAYAMARRYAADTRFAFGSWKIEILGGFASAIFMLMVAFAMVVASVERLWQPQAIQFREAIAVALLGLLVNLGCALILARAGEHGHTHPHGHAGHDHAPAHDHGRHDLNLRAAYLHVLADAATSLLAIAALIGAMAWGWVWLDPLMGLIGAALIANWARSLIADTSRVLLDREMDSPLVGQVQALFDDPDTRVLDLHLWRVGRDSYTLALSVVSREHALDAEAAHLRLAPLTQIVHATIEIHYRATL